LFLLNLREAVYERTGNAGICQCLTRDCDTPEEAANLTLRSGLLDEIEAIVKRNG
jgi:hypothetical protein